MSVFNWELLCLQVLDKEYWCSLGFYIGKPVFVVKFCRLLFSLVLSY